MGDGRGSGGDEKTGGPQPSGWERSEQSDYGSASTGATGSPAKARVGQREFAWPVPDRSLAVRGRPLSVELVVVGSLYALAALWLLVATRDIYPLVPAQLSGLFGSVWEFALSWLVLFIIGTILYLMVGLAYTAWLIFRAEPLGRGLSVVVAGLLVLMLFSGEMPGSLVLITLAAVAGAAVLLVSPWARRDFQASPHRHGRPMSVVVSQTVALSFFSLVALLVVSMLPGLRYLGDLGAGLLLFEVLGSGACVLAFLGIRRLRVGPDKPARLFLSVAAGIVLVGFLFVGEGALIALGFGVAAAVAGALWLAPGARVWFGEAPLHVNPV